MNAPFWNEKHIPFQVLFFQWKCIHFEKYWLNIIFKGVIHLKSVDSMAPFWHQAIYWSAQCCQTHFTPASRNSENASWWCFCHKFMWIILSFNPQVNISVVNSFMFYHNLPKLFKHRQQPATCARDCHKPLEKHDKITHLSQKERFQ